MTQPITKEALIRMSWITELRRQGHRQCEGEFFERGNKCCALGLLAEVAGLSKRQTKKVKWTSDIGMLAGLSRHQSANVWASNDDGKTFSEIADVVEGWFK